MAPYYLTTSKSTVFFLLHMNLSQQPGSQIYTPQFTQ